MAQLPSIMADIIVLIPKNGVCHVVMLPNVFFVCPWFLDFKRGTVIDLNYGMIGDFLMPCQFPPPVLYNEKAVSKTELRNSFEHSF